MAPPDAEPTYRGRAAVLATKHGKQAQLGPELAPAGLRVVVAEVDTDAFGTFSGEVPRTGTPLGTAVRKARAGMAAAGSPLGLASEGSFGPHPEVPLVVTDVELVVLVDDELGTVIVEQATGLDTPAVVREVAVGDDLSWLTTAWSSGQAVICRPADRSRHAITKGITEPLTLARAVRCACDASNDGRALVEPDLRADRCPARREVITRAARRLSARLESRCAGCGIPGFGTQTPEPGLPCGLCGSPTRNPAAVLLTCPRCEHRERRPLAGTADPATCERCNP